VTCEFGFPSYCTIGARMYAGVRLCLLRQQLQSWRAREQILCQRRSRVRGQNSPQEPSRGEQRRRSQGEIGQRHPSNFGKLLKPDPPPKKPLDGQNKFEETAFEINSNQIFYFRRQQWRTPAWNACNARTKRPLLTTNRRPDSSVTTLFSYIHT
jgi:hypothetical protein